MTWFKRATSTIGFGALCTIAACGGAAVPQEQLTTAKASTSGAEVGGAAEDPKAAFHLQRAKAGIADAERLIEEGDNEEAERALWRAQADAELALSLAKMTKAKAEAEEAAAQLEKLQKKSK
jgi:hypothetical protein